MNFSEKIFYSTNDNIPTSDTVLTNFNSAISLIDSTQSKIDAKFVIIKESFTCFMCKSTYNKVSFSIIILGFLEFSKC